MIVIVVVIKVFPGQGVGHLQDDRLGHARERNLFVFFIMYAIFFVTMLTMMTVESIT